jgi:hypothetical protein
MPRKELKYPKQIEVWLQSWGERLKEPGSLVLIGSGGLLWHAAQRGLETALPESVALLGYEAMIGSEFEKEHGWHVNLMPAAVLREMNEGWQQRASSKQYGLLEVTVPSVPDLLVPKLKRGEPRDILHASWAKKLS